MIRVIREGGAGSGNFDHAGRPGEVGGSSSTTAVAAKPAAAPGAEEYSGSIAPWDMKADAPPRYPGDTSIYSPALPDANGNYPLGRRLQGTLVGKDPGKEVVLYSFIPGSATPDQLAKLENIIESNSDHAQLHPGEIAFNDNGTLTKIPGNNYWIRGNYKDLQVLESQLTPAVKAQFGDKSAWSVMMARETPDGTKIDAGEPITHLRVVVPFEKDTPENTVGTPILSSDDRDKIMSVMSGDEGRRVWQHTDFNGMHIATDVPFNDKDYYKAAIRELGGEEDNEEHHDQHNAGATRFIPKDVNIEDYPVKSMNESQRMIRVIREGGTGSGDHGHAGRKGLRGGSGPPSKATLVKNILKHWNAADENDHQYGEHWYKAAHAFALGLAHKYGLTLKQTAGIIAALSPQTEWARNMTMATQLAESGTTKGLGNSINHAVAIRNGADPDDEMTANKTSSFYHNILDPEETDHVTIDRHAVALAIGGSHYDIDSLDNKGHYQAFVDAYKEAAKQIGVAPNVMQGVTWSQYRNTLARTPVKDTLKFKEGGAGSGNHDHAGRPGEVGGSASGGAPDGKWKQSPYIGDGTVSLVPIDTLMKMRGNKLGRTDLAALTQEIKENGLNDTPIMEFSPKTGYAYLGEGNHRVQALHDLGYTLAPVRAYKNNYVDRKQMGAIKMPNVPVGNENGYIPSDMAPDQIGFGTRYKSMREGGEGSGNFGHAGRLGSVGGSAPNDTSLDIAQRTVKGQGGSFSTHGEPEPTSGYMVAEAGNERVVDLDSKNVDAVHEAVQSYMNDKATELNRTSVYLGTWLESGKLFMDNSHNIQDRKAAFNFAHEHNQLAVYNVNTGEVENTMQDGKRPNETDAKITESQQAEQPHKFFFAKGVTAREIAEKLVAEANSRDEQN